MKFEKRAAAGETSTEQEPQETGKKPVIVYILILFLAAFLLMFLSLLAHQRSNSEALGKLQNSVSAIQEIQATQEQIIELQEKVDAVEKERDASTAPTAKTYTVKAGDSLWAIAAKYYGNGADYNKIFNANTDKISNPNLIYVGQVLTIP